MKSTSFLMAAAMIAGFSVSFAAEEEASPAPAAGQEAATEAKPQSPEELKKNIGYLLGYQTGQQMSNVGPIKPEDIDMEFFIKGLQSGLEQGKPDLDEELVGNAFRQYQQLLEKRIDELATKNLEEGKKFLEENAKKEGVTTTDSGLQYKIIEKGGDKKYEAPESGQDAGTRFKINYKGTLPNGEVFDETIGEPAIMPMEVIPGFKEALTMMPVGAKWEIYIPSNLGYGEQGAGGKIGPNQALVFELELLDILPPDPNSPQGMTLTPEMLQEMMKQAGEQAPQ